MNPASALLAAGYGPAALIAVALAAVGFALVVHNLRGRGPGGIAPQPPQAFRRTVPEARAAAIRDPGCPDWSSPDVPLLSGAELGQLMKSIAVRAGIKADVLPRIAVPSGSEGEFIFRDTFDYVYVGLERSVPMFEESFAVADHLMYRVFRDRAFMKAFTGLVGQELTPDEHALRLAGEQQAILGRIDPRWARQFACERSQAGGG